MTVLAVVAAMVSVWFFIPSGAAALRRILPRPVRGGDPAGRFGGGWKLYALLSAVLGLVGVLVRPVAPLAAVNLVAATLVWVVAARLRQRRALARVKAVVRAAQVIESLLGLGHVPATALALASGECPILEPVVAAQGMGGEPWEVLESLAAVDGQAGLAEIGHGWRVAQITGASMKESLEQVRRNLEESADLATIVAGELAGPRTTGQMLAVLPVIGLVMGFALGADPLAFFTGYLPGRACFLAGLGLVSCGVVWSEILTNRVSVFRRGVTKAAR